MIAIPVLRSRVAPVLNWCTKVVLVDPRLPEPPMLEPLDWDPADPFKRLRMVHEKGVTTVICGILSQELLLYAESLGMEVLYGISGDISDVIQGYQKGRLDEACFRMPGCRTGRLYRQHRYRPGGPARVSSEQNRRCSRARNSQFGGGSQCVCPMCGASLRHEPGIPCYMVACPKCGGAMIRG